MKFINEDGKLFGLINPIDLVVIIILFGVGIKILSDYRPAPLNLKQNVITIGVLVKNTPPYLVESVSVGQDVFQDSSNAYIGKIYSVKSKPAELLLQSDGQIAMLISPRNFDLHLTLKNKARIIYGPARSGVYVGKMAVRVGDYLKLHTLYSSLAGEVEYLKVNSHER